MRTYEHEVEESLLTKRLDRMERRTASFWRQIDEKEPDGSYVMSIAGDGYFQAVLAAWGLEDAEALAEHRGWLSRLAVVAMERFDGEALCPRGLSPLFRFGFADDVAVVRELAERVADQGALFEFMDPVVLALVLGDDAGARAAVVSAEQAFASPDVFPRHPDRYLPPVAVAILDGDEAALAAAAEVVVAGHIEDSHPGKDMRAGAGTLAHARLSVLCRVARWRGMTPPTSPYILEMID